MTGVLRGEPGGGDLGPTPRASPCLEDLGLVGEEEAQGAWATLDTKEYNTVDVLLYEDPELRVYVRGFVGPECIEARYLVVEACGGKSTQLLQAYDWPEVDKAAAYKSGGQECVELYSRPDPPVKARRLIEKLGITGGFKVLAYRPVEREEERFEDSTGPV